MRKPIFVISLLFALASSAFASPEQPKPVFGEKVAPTDFPELIAMIREEIQPRGRWEYVPDSERPLLETQLKVMEKLLAGHASVDELSNDEKLQLINAQEHANAILTQHDGRRLICERHTPTGSHRPKNICVTLAQRRQATEDSRRFLDDVQAHRALKASN